MLMTSLQKKKFFFFFSGVVHCLTISSLIFLSSMSGFRVLLHIKTRRPIFNKLIVKIVDDSHDPVVLVLYQRRYGRDSLHLLSVNFMSLVSYTIHRTLHYLHILLDESLGLSPRRF